jgi:glyoxylase-like metal-dependent hydrolase (beta-lactamase superfamily II)
MSLTLTRRQALIATTAAPIAAAVPVSAMADGHMAKPAASKARTFMLGSFEVTPLLAGTTPRDGAQTIFGLNVAPEEFNAVSAENFIDPNVAQFYFTPTLVNTGSEVILFDTGLNAAGTSAALADAGYTPGDVTKVVITHMHGDHVGGLMDEGKETFANAGYVMGQAEYDHWAGAGSDTVAAKVTPLAEKAEFVGDGHSVASGITSMAAFGHTPGHMVYMLESDGQQMLLAADLANHYVWSLAYPDWEVKFDNDKAAAAATRRKVLGMLATDKVPMIGYHMPFPAAGFVDTREDGFRYVPVSYQMMG